MAESGHGGDAKTIVSPNTSVGDIKCRLSLKERDHYI